MKEYIYHTTTIEVLKGFVDKDQKIEAWINSDPYPGYELWQLNYTGKGHQSVWKHRGPKCPNCAITMSQEQWESHCENKTYTCPSCEILFAVFGGNEE